MESFTAETQQKSTIETQLQPGSMLIATPDMNGSHFEKSVILLCSHGDDGTMGLICNHRVNKITLFGMMKKLNMPVRTNVPDSQAYFGGPVEPNRGFIIHTNDYRCESTLVINQYISLTSNQKILNDIITNRGPLNYMAMLGYTGWHQGQLDQEILRGSWINSPYQNHLLFNLASQDSIWSHAHNMIGLNSTHFNATPGHA